MRTNRLPTRLAAGLLPLLLAAAPCPVAAQAATAAPGGAASGSEAASVPGAAPVRQEARPSSAITPVPDALRGVWFAGACDAPEAMLAVLARSVARLPAQGPSRLDRFVEARPLGDWLLAVSRGAEAPRLLLRGSDAVLDTAEPDSKTRDDRLPGELPVTRWRRCDAPPTGWLLQHGEGVAVLGALEVLEAACGEAATPAGCAAALVAQADVSGDGLIGLAELARLLRGLGWVLAVQQGSTGEEGILAGGVGALGGLTLARLVLDSLDYDGDGRLSARELLRDRVPPGPGGGAPAGRPLRLEGFGEGVGFLRGLVEGLMGLH